MIALAASEAKPTRASTSFELKGMTFAAVESFSMPRTSEARESDKIRECDRILGELPSKSLIL